MKVNVCCRTKTVVLVLWRPVNNYLSIVLKGSLFLFRGRSGHDRMVVGL